MNIANFTTTANAAGEVGHYPLSTETLDFLQKQILLVQGLAQLTGVVSTPWVITSPTYNSPGLMVYNDELLPIDPLPYDLQPNTDYCFYLIEEKQDITTEDNRFIEARTIRKVQVESKQMVLGPVLGPAYARTGSELDTSNSPSLSDLHSMTLNYARLLQGDLEELDREAPPKRMQLFLAPERADTSSLPMSLPELKGAIVFTRLLPDSTKSFIQTLETPDGVKYQRTVISTSEVDRFDRMGINDFGWRCLPNQVIGSMHIVLLPQSRNITIHTTTGICTEASGANVGIWGGEIILKHGTTLIREEKVRVEVSAVYDEAAGANQPKVFATIRQGKIALFVYNQGGYNALTHTLHVRLVSL